MFCSDAVQSGADSLFGESLSIWPVAEIRTEASSSSIGTATLVGYGLLNCRWVFSTGSFFITDCHCQRHVKPQLGGLVIRKFQLPPPGVPHVWNDASEPQQRKVELWARYCREFCRKWRLPRHFWVLLHAVNLRHGTDGFTSPSKEGALRMFSPEKSDSFGRFWTRSPLDHRSRLVALKLTEIMGGLI